MNSKFFTPPPQPDPLLVNSREAARRLSISERTLWSLTKAGEIPSLNIRKCVRYRLTELAAWVERKAASSSGSAIIGSKSGV